MSEASNSALLKRFPQLEILVDPDQLLMVSGYAMNEGRGYSYTCGPLMTSFKPQRRKVYVVEFQFVSGGCEQQVYDITNPKNRIPVINAPMQPSQG
jgi:hypothetical protein